MPTDRKYILLDTNVLLNYYYNENEDVTRIMNLLTTNLSKSVTLFMPNFCTAEFFKILSSECFYKKSLSTEKFCKLKQNFINDISRDYKFNRLQKYVTVDLNHYHLFNAHLVYEPAMEYMRTYHEDPYFKKNPQAKKYISTFDLLVIAQGIELGHIHGYENFCILTSDQLMYDIVAHLRKAGMHRRYVRLPEDTNESYPYLKYFQYPQILKATEKYPLFDFLEFKSKHILPGEPQSPHPAQQRTPQFHRTPQPQRVSQLQHTSQPKHEPQPQRTPAQQHVPHQPQRAQQPQRANQGQRPPQHTAQHHRRIPSRRPGQPRKMPADTTGKIF